MLVKFSFVNPQGQHLDGQLPPRARNIHRRSCKHDRTGQRGQCFEYSTCRVLLCLPCIALPVSRLVVQLPIWVSKPKQGYCRPPQPWATKEHQCRLLTSGRPRRGFWKGGSRHEVSYSAFSLCNTFLTLHNNLRYFGHLATLAGLCS